MAVTLEQDSKEVVMQWIVGIATGLVAGVISSAIVYVITKKREEKEKIYTYWTIYLFNVMKEFKVWFPAEELMYSGKVGKHGSEWSKAIDEIITLTQPYAVEDRMFSEKETKLAQNVIIALNELGKWYGKKKTKNKADKKDLPQS